MPRSEKPASSGFDLIIVLLFEILKGKKQYLILVSQKKNSTFESDIKNEQI